MSYPRDYVAGRLPVYNPPAGTFTPGTNDVGIIEQVGGDVYGLHIGQRVLLTGYYVANENVPEPAHALLAMTSDPASPPLRDTWPDGTKRTFRSSPSWNA